MSTLLRIARCAAVLSVLCGSIAALAVPAPVVLNVRDFGAVGDGVTDDLDAMQAAATALCSSPAGSRLVYSPGTYLIDRYRVFRGPVPNSVDDVVYNNCNGVTISGYGAKIDVKGDFHMNADFFDEQWFSYSKQVTPFFMLDSSDFIIEGFEMYGNVDKMTKDAQVIEDNCAGIVTRRCSRYLLRDMNIHHFSVDAIELGWLDFGDDFITDKDARIENVSCHHNGRTAMAMVHVRRVWVIESSFNHAGHTEGAFGDFNPQSGIDIEPDFTIADGVDMHTGEIYFINTTWRGNKGPELLAAFPGRVEVFLTDLTLGATTRPPSVTTGGASAITATSATLTGTVNPGGMSAVTLFEYGIDTTYGSSVPAQMRTGTETQPISANIAVSCGTTYHFRAKVETSRDVRYGEDQSFVVASCPCTSFTIEPASANPSFAAGQQVVIITGGPAGCQGGNWTATEDSSWLTVSPAAGNGHGSVTVSWTSNEAISRRSAVITIAGNAFAVSQARRYRRRSRTSNGDRKSDILWYHSTTGEMYRWTITGKTGPARTWQ